MKRTGKRVIAVTLAMVITLSLMVTGLSAVSAAAKVPYAPANISTQNSGTGFNITWKAAANATGYKVYYKTAESGWEFKNTNTNSIKLDDLEYGTLYYIQVQSIGANGVNGGFSKVSSMTHVRSTRLISTAYNSNATVTVGWNPADGANGYAVAKKKPTDKSYTYYYTAETTFTDKNIEGGTIYYYQIRPYYTNGKSAAYAQWSNTKSLTTLYRPTITNVNSTDKRMNINWNRIFGAKGYRLAYKRATDSAWNYRTVNTNYYNVPNPTKGATYYIQVCAVKDSLAGPYSEPKAHEIDDPDKYKGLTYYEAGETVKVTHPAETELVWVVDEAAHDETKTEVKSVYHYRICQGCGAVGDGWTAEEIKNHDWLVHGIGPDDDIIPYGKPKSGYVNEPVDTILHVSEKGHYEVKVIKEAWEEDVTITQSGWYKTVTHPAETTQAKVIDKAAYYYEEPVYEYVYKHLCWGCDADVGVMDSKETAQHMSNHHKNGEISGYRKVKLQIKTGTNTINVPETSHTETVVLNEAWNEFVFVTDK